MARPKNDHGRLEALTWVIAQNAVAGDECFDFIFDVPQLRFLDKPRSPRWITCTIVSGFPEMGQQPVQLCKTAGCINGRHFKWGAPHEADKARIFPDRSGENNPNAKFTDEEVAQLRSVNWGNGRFKSQVAAAHGVTTETLHQVVVGMKYGHVKPYTGKKHGDEF